LSFKKISIASPNGELPAIVTSFATCPVSRAADLSALLERAIVSIEICPEETLDLVRSSAADAEPNFPQGRRFLKSSQMCPTAFSVIRLSPGADRL
jgi:hypothetical protein